MLIVARSVAQGSRLYEARPRQIVNSHHDLTAKHPFQPYQAHSSLICQRLKRALQRRRVATLLDLKTIHPSKLMTPVRSYSSPPNYRRKCAVAILGCAIPR